MFKHTADEFCKLYRRKAYVHWYTESGMDQMEFTEAQSNFNDIINEYHGYEVDWVDEEEEYGEEEEQN